MTQSEVAAFDLHAISIAFGTASFFMRDNDQIVRVDVDLDLLQPVPVAARTGDYYRRRLLELKRRFSRIALLKFRAGLHRSEVRMLVVAITARDMA
jgi:hypothetical protein